MARRRHSDPHIEKALRYAERRGWRVVSLSARAHGWGKMYCPHNDSDCRCGEFCITVVWGTPRSPENHARQLRRVVDGCVGGSRAMKENEE
jgi:acetolactate synthase regulatory subunit